MPKGPVTGAGQVARRDSFPARMPRPRVVSCAIWAASTNVRSPSSLLLALALHPGRGRGGERGISSQPNCPPPAAGSAVHALPRVTVPGAAMPAASCRRKLSRSSPVPASRPVAAPTDGGQVVGSTRRHWRRLDAAIRRVRRRGRRPTCMPNAAATARAQTNIPLSVTGPLLFMTGHPSRAEPPDGGCPSKRVRLRWPAPLRRPPHGHPGQARRRLDQPARPRRCLVADPTGQGAFPAGAEVEVRPIPGEWR